MASCAVSISSTATRGGCTFEELCNGSVQSYACDNLIDITETEDSRVPTIDEAVQMLCLHLQRCIQSIEIERGRPLEQFYIGKTHVQGKHGTTFNHMKKSTWRLDGVSGRWSIHRKAGYGRDGLVVLTVVRKSAIDPDIRRNKPSLHQEDYALALEGRLTQECMRKDPRVANNTLASGRKSVTACIGYPLYFCFKVKCFPTFVAYMGLCMSLKNGSVYHFISLFSLYRWKM